MIDRFVVFRFQREVEDCPILPRLRKTLCLLEAPRPVILRKKDNETRKTSRKGLLRVSGKYTLH